ncbi:hypothetical protein [Microbacterium sp.]|uniref:hypothetical protein n=1 Tax=Microbacterium sp. TaxID=51671 RepID=UPI003C74C321
MTPSPDIRLARRRDLLAAPDYRRVRRHVREGTWQRIAPGVFAHRADWLALKPLERHRLRVEEVAHRLEPGAVLSHFAAAAIHGIDLLGAWPDAVEVTIERATGGRSGGAVARRALGLAGVERVPFGTHEVTTPAQTALDLARALPFVRAVSAIDQAIWTGRPGGPLTTKAEILALLDGDAPRRGDARARRAIEAAEPLAANARETQMRLLVISLGFPRPRLQERRVLRSGRVAYGDLYFPDQDHWVEIDGRGKYLSPEYASDRDPSEIVIDEKNRENEIRREVRGFTRFEATDADDSRYVYDVLAADGMRSTKPRPARRR